MNNSFSLSGLVIKAWGALFARIVVYKKSVRLP